LDTMDTTGGIARVAPKVEMMKEKHAQRTDLDRAQHIAAHPQPLKKYLSKKLLLKTSCTMQIVISMVKSDTAASQDLK